MLESTQAFLVINVKDCRSKDLDIDSRVGLPFIFFILNS